MITKVLIAEDHESSNISVQKTLEDLSISNVDYVYYCDDALVRLKKAVEAGEPYDLLITDLSFEPDARQVQIMDGRRLIIHAREAQPELRILVFSAENKPAVIDALFKEFNVDGYVRKARNDSKELLAAIQTINDQGIHYPKSIADAMKRNHVHQFSDYDIFVIQLMAQGIAQKNIPNYLEESDIKPSGLSSVEKRLKHIRNVLEFSKNEQLVAFCKDMGII